MARKGYPAEFVGGRLIWSRPASRSRRWRLLDVSDQSIYAWRRQQLIGRGELSGLTTEERDELRGARRRIKELETELAVDRRAAELLK